MSRVHYKRKKELAFRTSRRPEPSGAVTMFLFFITFKWKFMSRLSKRNGEKYCTYIYIYDVDIVLYVNGHYCPTYNFDPKKFVFLASNKNCTLKIIML